MDKLKEIRAKLDSSHKNFKKLVKATAECGPEKDKARAEMEEMMMSLFREMDYMFSYAMEEIRWVENAFYKYREEHGKGHLPKIQGASNMEKALKNLGLEGDYEVIKPVVMAEIRAEIEKNGGLDCEIR